MSLRDLNLVPIVAHDTFNKPIFFTTFYVLREKIAWISLCTIEDNSLPVFFNLQGPKLSSFSMLQVIILEPNSCYIFAFVIIM